MAIKSQGRWKAYGRTDYSEQCSSQNYIISILSLGQKTHINPDKVFKSGQSSRTFLRH